MKIVTAIANEYVNEKLKQIKKYEIVYKDIQYQDALLEIIDKNKEIDLMILSNIIPGNLSFRELINIIKYKNENIKIITILDNQDDKIIEFLIKKGINDIFINNKVSLNELINCIENKAKKVNQKIESKNDKMFLKNNKIKEKIINKIKTKTDGKKENKVTKEIAIIGASKVGKSVFMILISLSFKNKKILLVSFENNDINIILGKKKTNNIKKYNRKIDLLNIDKNTKIEEKTLNKYDYVFYEIDNIEKRKEVIKKVENIILLVESNLLGLKETSIILEKLIRKWQTEQQKIQIVFNKINIFSVKKPVLTQLFSDFKILGELKYYNYYTFFINGNCKVMNLKVGREYKNIIKKINKSEGK